MPLLREKGIHLYIRREDTIHPLISGNKYRKLKYNLLEAKKQGKDTLLTFGGAFSNHIAATACAGHEQGIKTIGVIRGEELQDNWQDNPTLTLAHEHGMQFHFVSRADYRLKSEPLFIQNLKDRFGDVYVLPEGGTNDLAVKGCMEILTEEDTIFDYICCAVGTGGTVAGLINAARPHQTVLGFPALKGDFLIEEIRTFVHNDRWKLVTDYHFGGYAKVDRPLIDFINLFKSKTGIPLDPIYTGKMLFGIFDLVKKGVFPHGTQILAIHTGGLQGIKGMNRILKKKNLPLLDV
ncbi:MAG TPA: 1-aminocyclopropane-1-carboxylate deaminase [Muricauda sp.]|uniref:1-aminocyclopropane-1-carboxylate deaminase/D-cysteine desulfhydrase n=1 Tax=Flagellimonas aurea TaxID=2915619 RepID=A0ABS3G7M4_9FLAO|nr:pyridoxal-phosphate dependent enzyme [Allomuricauda aurea]MAO18154.1 1-aminocyclopropane-1-carboxylate deaminase [Allomuricauda sp.]MBC73759.1 1-aminocyclopropane-1-carboxylate deaminase [Allomuricauda sp.]MBO0355413.1 1-aminocyclopropane-1-carboxylate deaminase/D-cysteine desulfhydrase [Allomuricauda aurea]HBU76940.1 1-aminocyclopropane-1-carboxylate deaminase [Allomuricauda sp.]